MRFLAKKSYIIYLFKPGQNIMSLLKQNIQIPPIDEENGLKWKDRIRLEMFVL